MLNLNQSKVSLTLLIVLFFGYTSFTDEVPIEKEVSLYEIIQAYSKHHKKIIIPNDGLLSSLKSRKAIVVLPSELKDVNYESKIWKEILQNILNMYSYALIEKGNMVRLVPAKDTAKMPTPLLNNNAVPLDDSETRIITRVVILKHVVTDIVRPLFRYIQDVSTPLSLPDRKTIVITAPESSVKYFLKMVDIIDKPIDKPVFKEYHLTNVFPSEAKKHAQSFLTVKRARKKDAADISQQAFFLPDDKNMQLLVSAIEDDHKSVKRIIDFLESERFKTLNKNKSFISK